MPRFGRRRATGLVPLDDLARFGTRRDEFGGKAVGLALAREVGLDVPDTWVLPVGVFRQVVRAELPAGHDPASLLRLVDRPRGLERAARARDRLLQVPFDDELASALDTLWRDVGASSPWGLAVRSSATCEDDAVTSMAGLSESVIGVRSLDALGQAVRRVWASAVGADPLRYLHALRIKDVGMAVVLQPTVVARASGVMLTDDPSPESDAMAARAGDVARGRVRVASATLGLGVPIVAGGGGADTFRFAEDGTLLETRVVSKGDQLVVGERGLQTAAVDGEAAGQPALRPIDLAQLAEVGRILDGQSGGPHLVEFVVQRRGALSVVQVRRAGGHGFPAGGGPTTVWSRAGLGEALAGVLTPLTWSVFEDFSERGFRRSFASFGAGDVEHGRLVGRVHGRFYFNYSAFVRAAAGVPGLDSRALLDLQRGEGRALLEKEIEAGAAQRTLTRVPIATARLLAEQARLADAVERYVRDSGGFHRWLSEMDLGILPDDSLKTTLREVRQFFERTAMLSLSCATASLASHLALKSLVTRGSSEGAEGLTQAIGAGIGELDSAKPSIALAHVVEIARRDPAAARAIVEGRARAPSDLEPGPARRAIAHFLKGYGDHAVNEMELFSPRWNEDPSPLFDMMASGLRADPVDPDARLSLVRAKADRELGVLEARLSYVEVVLLRALVERLRRFTRLRERMRTWLGRALAMLRVVALDVDRRIRRLDPELPEGAAFFCTIDELETAVARSRADLAPLVRLRIAERARDLARPDPPVTFAGAPSSKAMPAGGKVLRGLPASAGIVTGTVRRVSWEPGSAARVSPGDVMVSATTDVALAPLFFVASGVATEVGTPLSHAAILARELGVPAVVGVEGISALRDGTRVVLDGSRGTVELLDS